MLSDSTRAVIEPPIEEVEAILACLGDDAALLRDKNPDCEIAANMDQAVALIRLLLAIPAADFGLSQPASEDAWLVESDRLINELAGSAIGMYAEELVNARHLLRAHLRARPAPEGFVLVPVVPTKAMNQVMYDGDWTWPDLLAAAESITEDEYNTLNAMLNAAKESGK